MSEKKSNRCWPGYEPVPGKAPYSQGSCRPKAESKTSGSEKTFRAKRSKQLNKWEAEHPGSRRQAAQHLSAPKNTKAKAKKKTTTKKSAGLKPKTKRTTKQTGARKTTRKAF
jgi:hypothetical protein